MSDGKTEARRSCRKNTYLNSIELQKDQLFDEYMEATEEYMELSIFKFGSRKIIKGRLSYIKHLIEQLDIEYKEGQDKPLKEF